MRIPFVSVVIPHFERVELLGDAVDSVLQSADGRAEVIVVDDGSSPTAWQAVQRLAGPLVRVIRREDGLKGPSRCRNLGAAASNADYVIFLDSDDLMASWCIERRLDEARTHSEADIWVFPTILFIESPGDSPTLWSDMAHSGGFAERFAAGDSAWHTSSPLWRRAAFTSLGGFNERVMYGDDSDLHLRAVTSGIGLMTFPDARPDTFVRRSDHARITNSLSPSLVESRRTRLNEGSTFLHSVHRPDLLKLWEGQYFVEAEFLLFNLPDGWYQIARVLADWKEQFHPSVALERAVQFYFTVAMTFRRRGYVVVRAARRAAMALFPEEFFPGRQR